MKKRDIEAIFTAKVQEYFANGYIISAATMNGHQGEIAKIDVCKGNEVIRILLESDHGWLRNDGNGYDAVVLRVGRFIVEKCNYRYINPFEPGTTQIWNNKLEDVEVRMFYQIRRDNDFFVEDYNEYCAMQSKQRARYATRGSRSDSSRVDLQGAAKDVAVRYIKRKLKKDRISSGNVTVTRYSDNKGSQYYVRYYSHNYKLA